MTEITTTTYGAGTVVGAHFADGKPSIDYDCDQNCDCPEHDYERESPKAAGTYVEVKLDNKDARVGLGRVVVLTAQELQDIRADAWEVGLQFAYDAVPDDYWCEAWDELVNPYRAA